MLTISLLIALINISTLTITTMGALTMLGADLSSLQRSEELGQKYYNKKGVQEDAMDILKSIGMNYVRLRVWNNPLSKTCNKEKVLQFSKVIKAKGLKLLIDFHYSDTWADPGSQHIPRQWVGHDIHKLEKDVYDFTHDVCMSLKNQGTVPDSVQIGNEINTGMLWPEGKVEKNNFTNLGLLLKSGIKAIKDCNKNTQTVIHTALVKDGGANWFYDGIKAVGVDWDITAQSYYSAWHGDMQNMEKVVHELKTRYNKPVIIAETSWPFSGTPQGMKATPEYPISQSGQEKNFHDVQTHARNGGAIGVFYWEPTWLSIQGNGWDPDHINTTDSGWKELAMFDIKAHINPLIKWEP